MSNENIKSALYYLESNQLTEFEKFAQQVRCDIARGSLDHLLTFPSKESEGE
jgi:hypothetical protein